MSRSAIGLALLWLFAPISWAASLWYSLFILSYLSGDWSGAPAAVPPPFLAALVLTPFVCAAVAAVAVLKDRRSNWALLILMTALPLSILFTFLDGLV